MGKSLSKKKQLNAIDLAGAASKKKRVKNWPRSKKGDYTSGAMPCSFMCLDEHRKAIIELCSKFSLGTSEAMEFILSVALKHIPDIENVVQLNVGHIDRSSAEKILDKGVLDYLVRSKRIRVIKIGDTDAFRVDEFERIKRICEKL